ncbi:helix-turn-helix domain-containing protein [Ensifer adhaerens]|uniref:helix-turn-helix domain-containing protein n=1 Tax=Ensifer adhaerens TaxID=106592 RepID=UPI0015C3E42E|nr:helix-turn-helix domain-containing protein [Ensifer adhaerens]
MASSSGLAFIVLRRVLRRAADALAFPIPPARFILGPMPREPSPQQRAALMIEALEAGGVSRSEIARAAHVSRNTVWRLASGEARQPACETVERIEKLFNARRPGR